MSRLLIAILVFPVVCTVPYPALGATSPDAAKARLSQAAELVSVKYFPNQKDFTALISERSSISDFNVRSAFDVVAPTTFNFSVLRSYRKSGDSAFEWRHVLADTVFDAINHRRTLSRVIENHGGSDFVEVYVPIFVDEWRVFDRMNNDLRPMGSVKLITAEANLAVNQIALEKANASQDASKPSKYLSVISDSAGRPILNALYWGLVCGAMIGALMLLITFKRK